MARRAKKTGKKRTHHRRRIGAVALNADSPMVQIGAVLVGYLMGDTINTAIDKVAGTIDPKLLGVGEAGLGAALMFMKLGKGKKGLLQVGAGGVLAGAGAKRALRAFGVITGFESVPVIGRKMLPSTQQKLMGYGQVPVVAGYEVPRMNGVFNGYQVPASPSRMMGSVQGGLSTGSEYMG